MFFLGTDLKVGMIGNSKFKNLLAGGVTRCREALLKDSTRDQYDTMNRHWDTFLDESEISHLKGILEFDLTGGQIIHAILVAYIEYLVVEKKFKPSTYRGRVAAAITIQRMAFHTAFSVPLMWKVIRKLDNHEKKAKFWLSMKQLKHLNWYIWKKANDGTFLYFACKVVWMLTTEVVYRAGSIIPKDNGKSRKHCPFSFKQITPVSKAGMKDAYQLKFFEKPKKYVFRTLYVQKKGKRVITLQTDNGGPFEAIHQYKLLAQQFERTAVVLGESEGMLSAGPNPRAPDKEALTQSKYNKWLSKISKKAGVYGNLESYADAATPKISDLRRSVMKSYAKFVGLDKLQYYVGHKSKNTAKEFYLGFNEIEMAHVIGSVPWRCEE